METYKVNLKNHLENSWIIFVYIVIGVLWPFYIYYKGEEDNVSILIAISIIGVVILSAPVLIIHLNYYFTNKGDILRYNVQERKITILHKGVETTFVMDDIDRVDRFMSFNKAADRADFLPWDGYNHSDIYLKDGQKITITSLLVPNLNLPIDSDRINVKTSVYRLARRY